MKKIECDNGHCYDSDEYFVCPRCHPVFECPEGQYDYEMYSQTGSYDFYKCKKCGKEIREFIGLILKDVQNREATESGNDEFNGVVDDEKIFVSITHITKHYLQTEEVSAVINKEYYSKGVHFKVIRYDNEYAQIALFAQNTESTMILYDSLDEVARTIGVKYNSPILVTTNGFFAGVLCSYIIIVDKQPINKSKVAVLTGIDFNGFLARIDYEKIARQVCGKAMISGFYEMMHYFETDEKAVGINNYTVQNTVLYEESFKSSKKPTKSGVVTFKQGETLEEAEKLAEQNKRTVVLNFANPVEPGGGVLRGAIAQEESICRASNLYKSLISKSGQAYYNENNRIRKSNQFNSMFIGSDMALYSPNVFVVRDVYGYLKEPYFIDVITCAAPFFSGSGYILPDGDLQHIFERRIRNVLEIAIEHEADYIILGAWGCGAFHNPPNVVANAFRTILIEQRYRNAFERILFVVKSTDIVCPNVEAFETYFSDFPNINAYCNERLHREKWKWVCVCGKENRWDDNFCDMCGKTRNEKTKTIGYS